MTETFDEEDHKSNDCHNSESGTKIQLTLRIMVIFLNVVWFQNHNVLVLVSHLLNISIITMWLCQVACAKADRHTDRQTDKCVYLCNAICIHISSTGNSYWPYLYFSSLCRSKIATNICYMSQPRLPVKPCVLFLSWTKRWKDFLLNLIDWRVDYPVLTCRFCSSEIALRLFWL